MLCCELCSGFAIHFYMNCNAIKFCATTVCHWRNVRELVWVYFKTIYQWPMANEIQIKMMLLPTSSFSSVPLPIHRNISPWIDNDTTNQLLQRNKLKIPLFEMNKLRMKYRSVFSYKRKLEIWTHTHTHHASRAVCTIFTVRINILCK